MSNELLPCFAVQRLLLQLGATPNYTGFRYCVDAVCLTLEDDQRLLLITKQIYLEIAVRYHTTGMAVERNIRTIIDVVWKTNPSLLQQLAGCPLSSRPCPGQFIAYLSSWLLLPEKYTGRI